MLGTRQFTLFTPLTTIRQRFALSDALRVFGVAARLHEGLMRSSARMFSLAVGLALASSNIKDLDVLYDGLSPAIVIIAIERMAQSPAIGNGVVLHGDGFIVTAGHVVEGAAAINVHFLEGERSE